MKWQLKLQVKGGLSTKNELNCDILREQFLFIVPIIVLSFL